VTEQSDGIAIQWQDTNPFAFALDPDLQIRELDVASAGSIADAQFLDHFGLVQTTLKEIGDRLGMAV
jgi:hypothetical protein